MLQNVGKTIGFNKNMVYKILPGCGGGVWGGGGGDKSYLAMCTGEVLKDIRFWDVIKYQFRLYTSYTLCQFLARASVCH